MRRSIIAAALGALLVGAAAAPAAGTTKDRNFA